MTTKQLQKKYYTKKTRLLNKANGFTETYYVFKPHYFNTVVEAILAAKEFGKHFRCYYYVFPAGDKFSFVSVDVNGKSSAKEILRALKLNVYV